MRAGLIQALDSGGSVSRNTKAAIRATIATAFGAALMLIPPIGVPVFLLVFMLPLWALDATGLVDLGRDVHGFFSPNAAGRSVAGMATWLVLFTVFRRGARKKVQ